MKTNENKQPGSIARISDKSGNLICWYVKSNSDASKYYQVRCKKIGSRCFWFCDCKASQFGYNGLHSDKKCSHVKAVIETEKARREIHKEEARKATAIARANAYRRELATSPWHGKCATTNNRAAHPAVVEAERHLAEQRKIEAFSFMK